MSGLADALHHAHQRGLLHRDLKPGNILFDADGRAYVSDFGLVKVAGVDSSLTRSVSMLGTPHYLAPEVAERDARAASVASDLWSLGAILYELLAQQMVFQADGVPSLLRKIVEENPVPLPSIVPRNLATITMKCLQKTPSQRYESAKALADDLQRFLRGDPVLARPTPWPERLFRWARKRPALAATSVMLSASVVTGAALVVLKNRELQETLRGSLLNEAHAIQMAGRVQQRDQGLAAIRKAAAIGVTAELCEEAASLLALPAVRLEARIPTDNDWWRYIPNEDLSMMADFTKADGIRILALPSRREIALLGRGGSFGETRHAFSPDGKYLLYLSADGKQLIVSAWRENRTLLTLPQDIRNTPAFSPDSASLAVGLADGRVEIYDLAQPKLPPTVWPSLGVQPAKPRGFSPDGRFLAVTDNAHDIVIANAANGKRHAAFGVPADGSAYWLEWFGDSTGVLVGSQSGSTRAWLANGTASRALPQNSSQVYQVAVQRHGPLALTSGFATYSTLLDWPSGRAVGLEMGNSMLSRFSQDGNRLVLHDASLAQLKFYQVTAPDACRQFAPPFVLTGQATGKGSWCAAAQPSGRYLASVHRGGTGIFELATGRFVTDLPEGNGSTLTWAKNGTELWIAHGRQFALRSVGTAADGSFNSHPLRKIDLHGHEPYRLALAESADHWIATVGDGVCYGSISQGSCNFVPAPPAMPANGILSPVALSPDGRFAVVSAELQDVAAVLDLTSGSWPKFIHQEKASFMSFTPDGNYCWMGSSQELKRYPTTTWDAPMILKDRETPGSFGFVSISARGLMATTDGMNIVLRDTGTGAPFLRLSHPFPLSAAWLEITPDGRYVTFSGMGHIQQVWDLTTLKSELQALGIPWPGR